MGNLLKERSRLCDEKWMRYSRNKTVRFILRHPLYMCDEMQGNYHTAERREKTYVIEVT